MPTQFHPSGRKAIAELAERWPDARLAAFGQTVFWDEPMKSVLVPMLDAYHPDAALLVGTHDADYFGKCPGLRDADRFVLCEHNDDATREIWAAVGEISALFGAEKVPTRALLASVGVHIEKLLRGDENRGQELIDACTVAWGWRGVVESGDRETVFRDVATQDALPAFERLLSWAANETLAQIETSDLNPNKAVANELLAAVQRHAQAPENRTLTKLFQSLWLYFYKRFLGSLPERVQVTSTCELFQFNLRTCALPRFRLVDYFLDPRTASLCRDAYSEAVEGSGMYELERFGSGALPFDLVVPGRGRGTVCLSGDHLVVDTDPHIVLDLPSPVTTARDLAAAVEDALGPDVALVGKAVALAFMFTSEFVFVLNEEGSTYVPRTRAMAKRMAEAGVPVALHPVLRLSYHTWDSLAGAPVQLRLPKHMASAFGAESVSGSVFARRWRGVVQEQAKLLRELARAQSPQDLMELLGHQEHPQWLGRLEQYVAAHQELLDVQKVIDEQKHHAQALSDTESELKAKVDKLQHLHGKMSRIVKPLRDQLEELRKANAPQAQVEEVCMALDCYGDGELGDLDELLNSLRQQLRQTQAERRQIVASYRRVETGPRARDARAEIAAVEAEAEAARLSLAAQAIRVTQSLPYADHRPTAWWLPIVDPSGGWYQAVLESTEVAIEDMM